jgi:LacI family transcriptional regulator
VIGEISLGATIKDIAKQTGLGLATISKYLNGGNVLEKNRIAIEKAIDDLDYTVNEFGRSLKTSRSKTVGVVIPELSNIFVTSIITVIEDILRQNGYSIIVCDCRTDKKREEDVVKFLMSKRVDGLIMMPVARSGRKLKKANALNVPVVLIDRNLEDVSADIVTIDNVSASKMAIDHLMKNGHENIGIIVGPDEIYTSRQRLKGYKAAFKNKNVTVEYDHIVFSDYTVQGGYEAMKKLIKEKRDMTAVFVTNYEMTLGAIIAINELGIKIPEQLSFIGFDNLQLSRIVKPKLSIIDQPLKAIGENVATIMLRRLSEEKPSVKTSVKLMTTLVERESVRKI